MLQQECKIFLTGTAISEVNNIIIYDVISCRHNTQSHKFEVIHMVINNNNIIASNGFG